MNELDFDLPKTTESGFTTLETDLFRPMILYTGSDYKSVAFDSGCTSAITPFKSDFEGPIIPVDKYMNGLGATTKVTGKVP